MGQPDEFDCRGHLAEGLWKQSFARSEGINERNGVRSRLEGK